MKRSDIQLLMKLLSDFSTTPCEFGCEDWYGEYECPLKYERCEILYQVSKFLFDKEMKPMDLIQALESDFKNTKE